MRIQTLLLSLVALIALIGFAWIAAGDHDQGQEPSLARTSGEQIDQPLGNSLSAPSLASKPTEQDGAARASDRAAVPAAAAVAPEREAKERGIEGRVVDSLGIAVAGAEVYCAPRSSFSSGSLAAMAQSGSEFLAVDQTTAGQRGEFRFVSAKRGELDFEVHAAGYACLHVQRLVEGGDNAHLDEFVLEKGMLLTGRVVDERGNALAGVAIHEVPQKNGGVTFQLMGTASKPMATSGPTGAFELDQLPIGPFSLRLEHDEHPGLLVTGGSSAGAATLTDQVYVMQDGHSIRGFVRGLEAGDHEGKLVRANPEEMNSDDLLRVGISGTRLAEIAADGQFELRGLREGKFVLQLVDKNAPVPMYAQGRSASVIALTGAQDVELTLRDPMGLTFQVLDSDSGRPLEEFDVRYGQAWMSILRGEDGEPLRKHPEGRVTIADVRMQDGATTVELKIEVDGYPPLSLPGLGLIPGEVLDLGVLRIKALPMISVQVLEDATGEAVQGAWVSFSKMPAADGNGQRRMALSIDADSGSDQAAMSAMLGGESNRAKTDKQGIAKVPSLPGELCQMKVTHRNFAEYTEPNVQLPELGGDELTARLEQGGTVVVTVLDAKGKLKSGAPVRESMVGANGPRLMGGPGVRKSRSDGTLTFEHLTAGSHKFQISEAGGGGFISEETQIVVGGMSPGADSDLAEVVEVREGSISEVTLHARPEGNFHGTLTEAGAPLAGATLSFEEFSDDPTAGLMRGMSWPGFGGGSSARTDGAGYFLETGLKVGAYTLTITHPSRVMPMEVEVEIREGNNTEDFNLDVAILEGRVVDTAGKPVAGIEVRPKRFVEPGKGGQSTVMTMMVMDTGVGSVMTVSNGPAQGPVARTDEDGRYSLRGVTPDMELVVESESDRYQDAKSKPLEVGRNQTRSDADLVVFEGGMLRILLRNPDGSLASNCLAELEFVGEAETQPDTGREFIGASGEATARSLHPGIWSVGARSMGGGASSTEQRTAGPVEIEVLAGETAEVLLEVVSG